MYTLEHIGIAVQSLAESGDRYRRLLGISSYKSESVLSESVNTLFFKAGASKIELLEASGPESAVARFIDRKGEGLHHVAFEVADIRAEMERLRGEGFRLLSAEPKRGADNKWVCFVHPKDASGVLIELTQEIVEST